MRYVPRPATIISVIALFVVTAGGGYAAGQTSTPGQQVLKLQRQVTVLQARAKATETAAHAYQARVATNENAAALRNYAICRDSAIWSSSPQAWSLLRVYNLHQAAGAWPPVTMKPSTTPTKQRPAPRHRARWLPVA